MFNSWWRNIKQHWVGGLIILIIFVVIILLIMAGYWFNWSWTGFARKTLWDWLGLLAALAIPIVVGFGVAWFTAQQGKVSARENTDNQREVALQAYIDKMSELLIKEHLGCELSSPKGELTPTEEEIRKIARVRTLTALEQLDGKRKRIVLQFLHESGMIFKDKTIIPLDGANLDGADLNTVHLEGANLDGVSLKRTDLTAAFLHAANLRGAIIDKAFLDFANLSDANLSRVTMRGTKLRKAILRGAILNEAILEEANLKDATSITIEELEKQAKSLKGATMPDGSIHP